MSPEVLAVEPRIFVVDGFVDAGEVAYVLAAADRRERLAAKRDSAGVSFPMTVAGDEVLEAIAARIYAVIGFGNDLEE